MSFLGNVALDECRSRSDRILAYCKRSGVELPVLKINFSIYPFEINVGFDPSIKDYNSDRFDDSEAGPSLKRWKDIVAALNKKAKAGCPCAIVHMVYSTGRGVGATSTFIDPLEHVGKTLPLGSMPSDRCYKMIFVDF